MASVLDKSTENKPHKINSHLNTFKNNVWELMTVHGKIINKAIEGLASEVKDLRAQLSVTLKERDDLNEIVTNLRSELEKNISPPMLTSELPNRNICQDTDNPESDTLSTEEDIYEQRVSSENVDQDESIVSIDTSENIVVKQAIDKWSNREDLKSHTNAMRSGKKKSSRDMKFPDVAERKFLKILQDRLVL